MNRLIKRYLLEKNLQVSPVIRSVLRLFKQGEIKTIYWIDQLESHKLETLFKNDDVISVAPCINHQNNIISTQKLETNLYLFKNAYIHPRSSHFIYGPQHDLMMERVTGANLAYCNYATGYLRFHNQTHAMIKNQFRSNKQDAHYNTLYLGGNGVTNYYHWLIEVAPKLLLITPNLLKKYKIKYLILDHTIQQLPSFQEILKLFLKQQQLSIEVIYRNKNEISIVNNLFYINHRNNFVYNSQIKLSSHEFSYVCPQLINKVRDVCLGQANKIVKNRTYPEKIFLARKPESVRTYNQDEILAYFLQQGFTAVYLEDYCFLEQVLLFNHAKFIIGPTGAAWSNLIFCQTATQALSWLPVQISEFSVFSTLAHIVQCDMQFILAHPQDPLNAHSNYNVKLDHISQLYADMLNQN